VLETLEFVIDYNNRSIPSCLPTYISTGDLIDITRIGDRWRRYINPKTNEIHDGAVYYQRYLDYLNSV
jgi:hypothetical protein